MTTQDLVGTWHLVSVSARDSAGAVRHPWGAQVVGQLVYDTAGNFSAHVMAVDRPSFASDDPAHATEAELRAAFDRFVAYFGTYSLDPARPVVTHHVQGASFPNWIGRDQVRNVRFDAGRLVLSTPAIVVGGQSLEYMLTWERTR